MKERLAFRSYPEQEPGIAAAGGQAPVPQPKDPESEGQELRDRFAAVVPQQELEQALVEAGQRRDQRNSQMP